jgi:hypothetical protein
MDTHKDTLAVAVVDEQGRQVASREVSNTDDGFADLAALFQRLGVVRVGIEGSGSFGRAVAVHLALLPHASWSVVEVPTLMTSRERRAQIGQGKTDPVDALAIARITGRDAAGESKLSPVRLVVGPAADLRALLDYRDDLLLERTALANRAHAELTGLSPGYQHQVRSLTTRARVRKVLELIADDHSVRADLTRRRLERIMVIDAEAAKLSVRSPLSSSTPAAPSPTSTASARWSRPGSWPRSSTHAATPPPTPSPQPTAPHPSQPRPAAPSGTATTPAGTASSTARSTRSRSLRSPQTPKAAPTTDANELKERPAAKPCAASNDGSQTASTEPCSTTPIAQPNAPKPALVSHLVSEQRRQWRWVRATHTRYDSRPDGQRVTGIATSSLLFTQAIAAPTTARLRPKLVPKRACNIEAHRRTWPPGMARIETITGAYLLGIQVSNWFRRSTKRRCPQPTGHRAPLVLQEVYVGKAET